jgi:hypothetical protein
MRAVGRSPRRVVTIRLDSSTPIHGAWLTRDLDRESFVKEMSVQHQARPRIAGLPRRAVIGV